MSARLAGPVSDFHPVVPWSSPAMVLLGFVALVGLVIALGRSSTARYEVGRFAFATNLADQRRVEPAAIGAASAAGGATAVPGGTTSGGAGPASAGAPARPAAAGSVGHPAGRSLAAPRTAQWWLVDDADEAGPALVAGPFEDRIDAEWAALSAELADSVGAAYGVLRADGGLTRRDPASDRAWLVALGLQLARLPEDWDAFLSDTDDLGTLVVDVGAALLEAGLPLYDCAAFGPEDGDPSGGVCLVPDPGSGGILAAWRSHDRMAVERVRGIAVGAAVQQTMTAALGDVLTRMGFRVEPLPCGAGHLVTLDQG